MFKTYVNILEVQLRSIITNYKDGNIKILCNMFALKKKFYNDKNNYRKLFKFVLGDLREMKMTKLPTLMLIGENMFLPLSFSRYYVT